MENKESLSGKYLTFQIEKEEYGIEILKIVEIIKYMEIREIPQTPDFILGLINLRDQVIPIMDLRSRFGISTKPVDEESVIIIIQTSKVRMGLLVDQVKEVIDIHDENIESTPDFGTALNTDFILALGKMQHRVTILLDIENVITQEIDALMSNVEQLIA